MRWVAAIKQDQTVCGCVRQMDLRQTPFTNGVGGHGRVNDLMIQNVVQRGETGDWLAPNHCACDASSGT